MVDCGTLKLPIGIPPRGAKGAKTSLLYMVLTPFAVLVILAVTLTGALFGKIGGH